MSSLFSIKIWKIMRTILEYLWNTKDQWLIYEESNFKSVEYWFQFLVRSNDKVVSGYVSILKRGATCWKDSLQCLVANFIYDTEFFVAFDAGKELFGYWSLLTSLEWYPSLMVQSFYTDSSTRAIAQAEELIFHLRTKYFLHRYHLVR